MEKQIGNVHLMQKMNRLKVLNFIRRNPDIARPMIAEQTGLSLSSITNVTSYLLEAGLLMESGMERAERVGRKSTLLRFCAETYGLIFACLNEDFAEIYYTNLEGSILTQEQRSIAGLTPEEVITLLNSLISALLKEYNQGRTLGIGVIFSGMVLDDSRFVLSSSMKWKDLDIKKLLSKHTNLPIFVENVSRSKAVWYSNYYQQQDVDNLLFLDLEHGIGAVQLCGGVINRSVLGEIGHTIIEKDGEPCFCGNKGCLEAMCSAERILKLYKERSGKTARDLTRISKLYQQSDEAAVYAVTNCAQYLGMGLTNLITMFHPSVLVLNPGDFAQCPELIQEAKRLCLHGTYPALTQDLKICEIDISNENILQGAAFELCDSLFDIRSPHNPVQ